MKKKLLITTALILALAFIAYKYVYQSHRDISEEQAAYTLTAKNLTDQFFADANTYQKKYLNKTIAIEGVISQIEDLTITINDGIFCTMITNFDLTPYKIGQNVSVKGRFIGYDDLLEEIKLDQCSITK